MSIPSDILLKRAEVLIDQERYELAEKELYKILTEEPHHIDAIANLVRCLTGISKYSEAQEWLYKLLYLAPEQAYFYYLAAFVEVRTKELDKAEEHIRTAIKLEPDWAIHFEVLSRIYQHRGKYEEGLLYANEGLRIDPDHIDCLDARLFSLAMLGQKKEAWQTIHQVLRLDPENSYLRRDIGVALLHLGEYDAAEFHLRETLRIDPSYEDAKKHLGKAIRQKNPVYKVHHHFNSLLKKLLAVPSHVYNTGYGYTLVLYLAGITILSLFVKKESIVWLLLGIPLAVLISFIMISLAYILFNIVWKPVLAFADIWLYTHIKHKDLYTQETKKTTIVALSIFISAVISIVLFYIWLDIRPALSWTILSGTVLYYIYTYYKKHNR